MKQIIKNENVNIGEDLNIKMYGTVATEQNIF